MEEGSKVVQQSTASGNRVHQYSHRSWRRKWEGGSLAGDVGTVLKIWHKEQNSLSGDRAGLKSKGYNTVTLNSGRACFLFSVIKALIAIITIVLFLRIPQRMMQEGSLILWLPCQKIFRASKEMGSSWVKSCLARGEEAGWHICRLAGVSVNFLR